MSDENRQPEMKPLTEELRAYCGQQKLKTAGKEFNDLRTRVGDQLNRIRTCWASKGIPPEVINQFLNTSEGTRSLINPDILPWVTHDEKWKDLKDPFSIEEWEGRANPFQPYLKTLRAQLQYRDDTVEWVTKKEASQRGGIDISQIDRVMVRLGTSALQWSGEVQACYQGVIELTDKRINAELVDVINSAIGDNGYVDHQLVALWVREQIEQRGHNFPEKPNTKQKDDPLPNSRIIQWGTVTQFAEIACKDPARIPVIVRNVREACVALCIADDERTQYRILGANKEGEVLINLNYARMIAEAGGKRTPDAKKWLASYMQETRNAVVIK